MDSTPKEESMPTYWISIPAEIYTDTNIPHGAKILYGIYNSMSKKFGVAWPSNRYIANILDVSEDTISRWTSLLVKADHISIKLQPKADNKTKRLVSPHPASAHELMFSDDQGGIRKNADTPPAKMPIPSPQKSVEGIGKNAEHINTSDNTRDKGQFLFLPDFLDGNTKKGKIYLTAKLGYQIGGGPFFRWFESEVLNRFSKFNNSTLNNITLKDWDELLFMNFDKVHLIEAIRGMPIELKGNLPGAAEVLVLAKRARSKAKQQQEARDIKKRTEEVKAKKNKPLVYEFMSMSETELVEYYASEGRFYQILVERKRPEIFDFLKKLETAK